MLKVHTYEASGSLQMSQSFFLPVSVMCKSKVKGWEYGWRTNFTAFQLHRFFSRDLAGEGSLPCPDECVPINKIHKKLYLCFFFN